MAAQEQVLLDATGAYAGAARLRAAGAKWGEAWGRHSQILAGLEATARFGGDATGVQLQQNYRSGSQGLSRAAAGVTEGCKVFADSCNKGVAMTEEAARRAATRVQQA